MGGKKDFNFDNYFNAGAMEQLFDQGKKIAPTKKEVDIVKKSDGDTRMLPLSSLVEYKNHTYKVLDNEDMADLVDSIKDYGIILPLLVRAEGKKYEVLSGHRRMFAAKKLKLKEVPCKVLSVDDDMADIIMADTNLARETILPSEKAKTYKLRLEAAVRQGKKPASELEVIAEESPDSLSKIKRYLRVATLSPTLLDMIDEGRIPVIAGVTLSSLSPQHQDVVEDALLKSDKDLTLKTAEKLKTASTRGLTMETADSIINGNLKPRATKKQAPKAKLTEDMIADAVPKDIMELPLEERVAYYKKAIKAYAKNAN